MTRKSILSIFIFTVLFGAAAFWSIKEVRERVYQNRQLAQHDQEQKGRVNEAELLAEYLDGEIIELDKYIKADIGDWKVHRDEDMGFEMKIPKDWICWRDASLLGINPEEVSRKESLGIKGLACLNESLKKETFVDSMRRENGSQDRISIVISNKKEEEMSQEKLVEGIIYLKEQGEKLYSAEIVGEKRIVFVPMNQKGTMDGLNFSVNFKNTQESKELTLLCGMEDKCFSFAKSAVDTLKILK